MTRTMESFPLFFRIRTVTFTIIMLFSFLWLVLLSVEMFARWSVSDEISHSLMILFFLTNTTTLILLPILILVPFRVWLDAARLLLLLVLQAGSAVANTYWTSAGIGVCQVIDVYTMLACWIVPAILVFYSTYFAVVVYLQSRIPVVVEPNRSGVDPEMGPSDSHSLWKGKMKEIVRVQSSNTDTTVSPRPLVLPTMIHAGQPSLSQSPGSQCQSTLLNASRRQSTMPFLPHTGQQFFPEPHSVPNRHRSLPAFKHAPGPDLRPLLTSSILRTLATSASSSHPQTPTSYSYSTPSSSPAVSQNQFFGFEPVVGGLPSPRDHRWRLKHLSMMPPSPSIQSADGSPTTRSTRARLSKPLPAHAM
ncbi:hypothetical protein HD554DRAFT_2045019 [Boletus coccyginus]|nr:hypothetical protein HD554DRAFT_2045019 [Boletus coccyginus]